MKQPRAHSAITLFVTLGLFSGALTLLVSSLVTWPMPLLPKLTSAEFPQPQLQGHLGGFVSVTTASGSIDITSEPSKKSAIATFQQRTPLQFEMNGGQTDESAKFLAHGKGYNLFLTATEAVLALDKDTGHARQNNAQPGRDRLQLNTKTKDDGSHEREGDEIRLHPTSDCKNWCQR